MAVMNRRGLVAAALPAAGVLLGTKSARAEGAPHAHGHPADAVPDGERTWDTTPSREILKARYFPNVVLTSHEGQKVRFYDDLLKDKVVMINMMYTRCRGICPGVTANLLKVQKQLGAKVGREVFMYSISLRPEEDTPAALQAYAKRHRVQPGWSFLTGAPGDIETLRRNLGYSDPDPAVDADSLQHTGVIVYGNEARELWASCPATGDPGWIVESVGFVMDRRS
jgi:protein SCO1/2